MNEKLNNITKFWIVIGVLIGVIFGITLGVFGATLSYFNIYNIHITPGDSIAIANTYIVFISIIFILFTIAVTIGGYIFSKIFTLEKQREIHQNIVIISNQLKHHKETRDVFIDEILNNRIIIDIISKKISSIIDKIKEEEFQDLPEKELTEELISILRKGEK